MDFLLQLKNRIKKNVPFLILVVGCFFMFFPSFFPEFKILYCIGVWIWPFCFLYYGRLSKTRFDQTILFVFLALGLSIRFFGVLGQGLELESLLLTIFAACAFWVPFAWDVRYCRSESPFIYTLCFPVVYGTLNLILSACNVIPICNLAYAQYDNKALLQIVSVIGEYGLTFLITWVASIAVFVIEHRQEASARYIGIATLAILLGIHVWGGIRYCSAEVPMEKVLIAQAIGPKLNQEKGEWERLPYERNEQSFDKVAKDASEKHADMLVFSEEAFTIMDTEYDRFLYNAREKAREYGFPILLPLEVDPSAENTEGRLRNEIVLIDRAGNVVADYLKRNAVPVVESNSIVIGKDDIPTVSLRLANDETYRISFAICYDGNFSEYVRQMDTTTQLYFNPSWDWESINDFHYRSIGIRSVENGVNLTMTTYDGWSIVVDPYGKELYRTNIDDHGYEKVFLSSVPTESFGTIYTRYGGTMNIVYPIASLLFIAFGRRKSDDEDDDEDD